LHGTHIGRICPAETPEGGSVGVVKNATLSCSITIDTPEEPIYQYLIDHEMILIEEIEIEDITNEHIKVFMNGNIRGFHKNPYHVVEFLIKQRRKGAIADTVSIRYNINAKEINIYTDCGRPYRPLFIVKNGKLNMTKKDRMERLNDERMYRIFRHRRRRILFNRNEY
jgi:DNA-directed RNA polymerase II subunit RPB2